MLARCFFKSETNHLLRGFASKMQAGCTKNNKDNAGRRLGVKKFGSNEVQPGDIVARQRGLKWHPGQNTYLGKDHTIHSKIEGYVHFEESRRAFKLKKKKFIIHVLQAETSNKTQRPAPYMYHPELWPERAETNPAPFVFEKKSVDQESPVPILSLLGKGKPIETPKYQNFLNMSTDIVPRRKKVASMADQILTRVNRKIGTYLEGDIQIAFSKLEDPLTQALPARKTN